MSAQDIRLSIFQIVNETEDKDMLRAYFSFLKTLAKIRDKLSVAGYDVKGKPVTAKDLEKLAEKAVEQVKNGNYIPHSKMMESVGEKSKKKVLPIFEFERSGPPVAFEFGSGKHLITYIADDFDAPLEEFRDYM